MNLPQLSKRYPIAQMALFGSYARGEQTPQSDIDLMVELNGKMGWDYLDLCMELQALFPDKKVDVVTKGSIQPHYWEFMKDKFLYV